MVPLPLFKFAALFVRHVSKYGAVSDIFIQLESSIDSIRTTSKHKPTTILSFVNTQLEEVKRYTKSICDYK